MAAITAALVGQLRERTGMGMMECKRALTEADGDIDVLTRDEIVAREKRFWWTNTPIGFAFGAGVVFREPLLKLVSSPMNMADKKDAAAQQLWTCSMHRQVIMDHAGFCPICHMALTPLSAGAHATTHAPGRRWTAPRPG